MVLLRAVLLSLGLAGPAAAQVAVGEHYVFETRFGQVQIVGSDATFIWFNGTLHQEMEGSLMRILLGYGITDAAEDWLLLREDNALRGCVPSHRILRVTASGVSWSPAFGHCAAVPLDVQVLPGQIEVVMSHPNAAIDQEVFVFDGASF